MTTLYLIRHGQAGTREDYDRLSDLGEMQATELGRYFAGRELTFDMALAGEMRRQQRTAASVLDALSGDVSIAIDRRWNEFSLADVYRRLAPRLIDDSTGFAADYDEMQRALADDPHTTRGAAGRCDRAVIEAWMDNRYQEAGELTWESFRAGVESVFDDLIGLGGDASIAVFTSATPIAIWVGRALSLSNDRILRLMAVLLNSSVTTIRLREGEPLLLNFNMTPHLAEPRMVTYR